MARIKPLSLETNILTKSGKHPYAFLSFLNRIFIKILKISAYFMQIDIQKVIVIEIRDNPIRIIQIKGKSDSNLNPRN